MSYRTQVALGLTGGYLLGRYRKTRWLLAVVALVASRRLGSGVMQRGTAVVDSSPELKKLAEQGREAAVGLVGGQIQALTDRVHARTESLRPSPPRPEDTGDGDRESGEEPESGGEPDGGGEPEAGGEPDGGGEPDAGAEAPRQPSGRRTKVTGRPGTSAAGRGRR